MKTVVDVGCGDGFYLTDLPGNVRGIGFDVSDAGFPQNRNDNMSPSFIQCDARNLPLTDGVADVVLLLDVIEHIREDRVLLQEMKRVLAPNGRIILSTPNTDSYGLRNKKGAWFAYRDATHCNLHGYEYWSELLKDSGFICMRMGSDFLWDHPYHFPVNKKVQLLIAGSISILTRSAIGFLPWKRGENVFAVAKADHT